MEREEVGALAALHVDHLDVLAGLHLVGERRGARNLEVEARLRQRLRQRRLELLERHGPRNVELQVGRGNAAVDDEVAGGRRDRDGGRADGAERLLRAGRRRRPEEKLGTVELERAVVVAGDGELGSLPAVEVAHGEPVVRPQLDDGRPARPHAVGLPGRVAREQARYEEARASGAH